MAMRVAVISGVFPKVSETFVMRHVTDLLARGHEVEIYSDYRPRADEFPADDPQAVALAQRTVYMEAPSLRSGRRLLSAPLRIARCARVAPGLTASALNPAEYGLRALSLSQIHRLYLLARPPRRYDIIHAHFGMVGDRYRATSALWDAPLAVSFHGFDYSVWPRKHGANCYQRLFRSAARIVVNSENTRRRVAALGCPQDKLAVITPQWDMARFDYQAPDRQAGEPFRALSVARLVDKKGIDDAVQAVALARRTHPELRYDIVGDGPQRPALESLIQTLGQGDTITLHGAQPPATVSQMMRRAHALLAPSRLSADGDEEGLGVVLLEAQAAGVPVIATRHGPFPEIVTHGETGLLTAERAPEELARSLDLLLARPDLAQAISAAARAQVESRFAPDGISRETEALYRGMIEEWRANHARV